MNLNKLHHALRLVHEWATANQNDVSDLVLNEVVTAENAIAETIDFIKAGL